MMRARSLIGTFSARIGRGVVGTRCTRPPRRTRRQGTIKYLLPGSARQKATTWFCFGVPKERNVSDGAVVGGRADPKILGLGKLGQRRLIG